MTTTAYSRKTKPLTSTVGGSRLKYEPTLRRVAPGSRYHEKNSRGYRERIDTLLGHASEEGIVARDESRTDFNLFVDTTIPTSKAMLVILDNGNLRATWRECRSRLSLEFTGDRLVRYVVFMPEDANGQPFERADECSFNEIRTFTKRWGLWDMVAS